MEPLKEKSSALQRINWRSASRIAALAAVVILLVWACISTSNTSDMQQKYASSRAAVGDALYGCASMLAMEYDSAEYAGADIEGEILPNMRIYYAQVQALNNAMSSAYGSDYTIFDGELMQDILLAFDEYDAAFATGHTTEAAHARMTDAMTRLRKTLDERYDKNANLK